MPFQPLKYPSTMLILILVSFVTLGFADMGKVTHYWDCCKPECSWPNQAPVTRPVYLCDVNNNHVDNTSAASSCTGGNAFMCSNQGPWATSEYYSYATAAVNVVGENLWASCCSCYELTFKTGALINKKIMVQATNYGHDLDANQFDIAVPGGGQGAFTGGCPKQWGNIDEGSVWGGGFQTRAMCDALPAAFKDGCRWKFDWYQNVPAWSEVEFFEKPCPQQLIDRTGCWRYT